MAHLIGQIETHYLRAMINNEVHSGAGLGRCELKEGEYGSKTATLLILFTYLSVKSLCSFHGEYASRSQGYRFSGARVDVSIGLYQPREQGSRSLPILYFRCEGNGFLAIFLL